MRKIVLCLSMLLAILAVPDKAQAWVFTGKTNPYKVVLHFDDPVATEFSRDMSYDSTNKMWSLWFTARQATTSFRIEAFWGTAQNPGGSSYIGNDGINYDANAQPYWQWYEEKYPNETSAPRLRISNLKVGASYRIDVTDNGSPDGADDANWACYRVTKVYDNFFLYTGVSAENVKQVAEGINTDGTFVFYAKGLTNGQSLYLSRTGGETTWNGMQYNDARYNPSGEQNIPGTGISFSPYYNGANNGGWKTTAAGNYVITVDWANQKLSAFNKVYLYTFGGANFKLKKLGTSAINANDCACFEVDLTENQYLFLSTNDVTSLDPLNNNGGRIAPSTGDVNVPVKDNAIRFNAGSGSWKATEAGRYIITLDMSKNSFSAVKVNKLYLYKRDNEVAQIKEITLDSSLKSTFPATIADNQYLFLSTNAGATTWAGLAQYNGRLNPGNNADVQIPALNTSFVINTGQNGSWKTAATGGGGNYVFTVDYAAKTLSAFKTVYLYEYNAADGKVTKVGTATFGDNSTIATFYTDLTAGRYLMLSSKDGVTSMDGFGSDRFNPYDQDISIPAENTSFAIHDAGKKGSWFVSKTGRYAITVDWAAQKLSASSTIYLYRNRPDNWNTIGASDGSINGKYTFTAYFQKDDWIVLSQKANGFGWGDISSLNWAPENDTDVVSNVPYSFRQKDSGAWHITKAGRYSITVDWVHKTLVANEIMVDMPLTTADFAGNKKHYFLVGERLGEWHLQPEWEFKEVNGELVLNNRYFYNGGFAVGVVDNYEDYITHTFTYYSTAADFNASTLSSNALGSGKKYHEFKGNTRYNPADCFYAKFDGNDAYYSGYGTFMSSIKVTLSGGTPTGITFTKGSTTDAAKQRVFTLVGDHIINNNYNNVPGIATTMQNRDRDGWMDSWIQYNPATNKPYVDGNGEYLYHTSFTPDYLTANPVQFNIGLDGGNKFAYTSSNIQFVEYNHLNNLASDPYYDFYTAFSGKETISNNGQVKNNGNGTYNFKVKVACDNPTTAPTDNWSCYVIRDVWIAGQIKFWSGWGGNVDWTDGGTDGLAVWHGPNGGPDIPANTNYDVKGYDINSGLDASLYKNVERRGNTNYKISDGKPVYFNRVILWYNNADGVSKSYIQFIQESAGPAIFAQVTTNTTTSKNNWIKSNWYLNKSQQDGGDNALVKSYEIRRYRIVDGKAIEAGVVKSADISGRNIKVSQLYESAASSLSDITTFTDKGMADDSGFAPGLYEYVITVVDEFGGSKKATSNRVAIYDDTLVTPDAVPMQLVELRGAYTDDFGTYHAAASDVLGKSKRYLTYRTNDNDNFYVMNINVVDGKAVPADAEIINSKTAIDFLKIHPDKYFWTSDYYLRCLDYNQYASTLQTYIDNAIIKESTVPAPTVKVYETYTADGGSTVTRERATASPFIFGDKTYYSAVVKRGGNLSNATFKVELSYSYTKTDDTKANAISSASTQISPVVPMPRDPKYRYVYSQPENTASFGSYVWGKIKVPAGNWESSNATKDVYVKLDDNFDPRQLDLQVDFTRPNVNSEIYSKYNIAYNLNVTNDNTGLDAALQVPLNIDGLLVDKATTGDQNRYRFEIKGMNARNDIVPTVKITSATYTPISASVNGEVYGSNVASYGDAISFNANHVIQSYANIDGLKNVHLGKVQREDGKWDWMYKGHESFSDDPAKLEPTDKKYEDASAYSATQIVPRYYLIEVKGTGSDKATYSFLVPHIANHHSGSDFETDNWGLILNDSDPLIGTYIAEDFYGEETPTIYATAIYIFKRQLDGNSSGTYDKYTNLSVQSFKVNGSETASSGANLAPARIKENYTNAEITNNGVGELPKTSDIPTENVVALDDTNSITGFGSSVVKGATYQTTNNELVTGADQIDIDNLDDAVYYDLRGMRIDRPSASGVYLRVTPAGVQKVVIK